MIEYGLCSSLLIPPSGQFQNIQDVNETILVQIMNRLKPRGLAEVGDEEENVFQVDLAVLVEVLGEEGWRRKGRISRQGVWVSGNKNPINSCLGFSSADGYGV